MPSVSDLTKVKKFLDVLSWTKIAQLSVFLLIVALGWTAYVLRDNILGTFTQTIIQKTDAIIITSIPTKTTHVIDNIVRQSDLIIGITIVNVNFQRNLRTIVYSSIEDPDLTTEYLQAYGNSQELPLFNSDVTNNKRLVGIINGEFICSPYSETVVGQIHPVTRKYVNTTCISGIPPYYGAFSGIVNIYLKREPTSEEIDQVRVISRNISVLVYESRTK